MTQAPRGQGHEYPHTQGVPLNIFSRVEIDLSALPEGSRLLDHASVLHVSTTCNVFELAGLWKELPPRAFGISGFCESCTYACEPSDAEAPFASLMSKVQRFATPVDGTPLVGPESLEHRTLRADAVTNGFLVDVVDRIGQERARARAELVAWSTTSLARMYLNMAAVLARTGDLATGSPSDQAFRRCSNWSEFQQGLRARGCDFDLARVTAAFQDTPPDVDFVAHGIHSAPGRRPSVLLRNERLVIAFTTRFPGSTVIVPASLEPLAATLGLDPAPIGRDASASVRETALRLLSDGGIRPREAVMMARALG